MKIIQNAILIVGFTFLSGSCFGAPGLDEWAEYSDVYEKIVSGHASELSQGMQEQHKQNSAEMAQKANKGTAKATAKADKASAVTMASASSAVATAAAAAKAKK